MSAAGLGQRHILTTAINDNDEVKSTTTIPRTTQKTFLPSNESFQYSSKDLQQNKTKSSFLRLPLELRYEIYQHVFGYGKYHLDMRMMDGQWKWFSALCDRQTWIPHPKDPERSDCDLEGYVEPCGSIYDNDNGDDEHKCQLLACCFNASLLKTCRQTYIESLYYFYSSKTFIISSAWTLLQLPKLISPQGFSFIKSLEIAIDCDNLSCLHDPELHPKEERTDQNRYGFRLKSSSTIGAQCSLNETEYNYIWTMLKKMDSLRHLRVFIHAVDHDVTPYRTLPDGDDRDLKRLVVQWLDPVEEMKSSGKLYTFDLMLNHYWFEADYFRKEMTERECWVLTSPVSSFRVFQGRGEYLVCSGW